MLDSLFVLLPRDGRGDAHHTLVYMGPPGMGSPSMELCASLARGLAMMFLPPKAVVQRHAMFGMNSETPVAVIEGTDLHAVREPIAWLANSRWGYSPHVSQQPGYPLPPVGAEIVFDRIGLWYGDKRVAFRFGTGLLAPS